MEKERLDILLVEKNLVTSRERAKTSIMAGLVYVDGQKIEKAGTLVPRASNIVVAGDSIGFVSRGGLKLAKALDYFNINLQNKIIADIGASTGGFTDCALKNGALRVYSIDVGYGQLAWSLRTDSRVINMERTNIRNVTPEDIGDKIDFACIDVAFISLTKVLPAVKALLAPDGEVIALIKPQFEAGKDKVGKKGVVRDPAVHASVIENVINTAVSLSFQPLQLTFSPIKGPEGNIEYLIHLSNCLVQPGINNEIIDKVVHDAHTTL